jgi:hypothetical protein
VAAPTTSAAFAAFLKEDRVAAEALVNLANSKQDTHKPD